MTRRDTCLMLATIGGVVAASGAAWWNGSTDTTCEVLSNCPSVIAPAITTAIGALLLAAGLLGLFVLMLGRPD